VIRAALLALLLAQERLPSFRGQVLDDALADLWAMSVADVNGDGRPDVLALNWEPAYVVWYENPGWKKHTLIEKVPRGLVALQPIEVDGKAAFVLGAEYHEPPDPKKGGGGIHLFRPGGVPLKLGEAPTLHRIHLLDGKDLVCSTLHGPTFVLRRPAKPFEEQWARETVAERLGACHNTLSVDWDGDGKEEILTASREGLLLWKKRGAWEKTLLFKGNGGVSEVAVGRGPGGKRYVATIEPHHGAEFCVYTEAGGAWTRELLLVNKGGHTLVSADLTKTGVDSLLAGFVGRYSDAPGGPVWHLFHPTEAGWERRVLDDTKLPGEDGAVADLDGDGRLDCVLAGGKRVKVWWQGQPR
jgi:hypothetical protein